MTDCFQSVGLSVTLEMHTDAEVPMLAMLALSPFEIRQRHVIFLEDAETERTSCSLGLVHDGIGSPPCSISIAYPRLVLG